MPMQDRKVVHADIKPENPPERAAHFVDVPKMPWETTKFPGIKIKVLYTDDTGVTTALFKLDPGAVVPLHEHTALEQTYVIEGTLEDHEGVCGPGQFVWRPAGNQHEAVAPNGAVLLGFFLKPNRFAYGERFFTEKGEIYEIKEIRPNTQVHKQVSTQYRKRTFTSETGSGVFVSVDRSGSRLLRFTKRIISDMSPPFRTCS